MLIKRKISTIDLFDSYINHNEFGSVNNVLKEYDAMKEAIKSFNTFNSGNEYDWYSKKLLISEKEFTDTNYERLKKDWFS